MQENLKYTDLIRGLLSESPAEFAFVRGPAIQEFLPEAGAVSIKKEGNELFLSVDALPAYNQVTLVKRVLFDLDTADGQLVAKNHNLDDLSNLTKDERFSLAEEVISSFKNDPPTFYVKATLYSDASSMFTPELNLNEGRFNSIEEAKQQFMDDARGIDLEETGGFSPDEIEAGIKMRLTTEDGETLLKENVPVPGLSYTR